MRSNPNGMTLWSRRDPFREFDALVRGAFGPAANWPGREPGSQELGFQPAADVVRDGDDTVIRLELPGVDVAKDVEVEVHDGHLVVHGERRDEQRSDEDGRSFREIRYGSFRRAFRLPRSTAPEAVSASYDAGVLTIRVSGTYAADAPHKVAISTPADESSDA